ncbi:MAG: mandelate racemase/muconate lactonizing enzyme family protein [Candidatus Promineifilaceae bacterium]
MKITEIHIYQHDLPIKGKPYTMARATLTKLDTTIVEIVTDTGVVGYGETCPLGPTYQPHHALGARAALREIAPHLLGQNPLVINALGHLMDEVLAGHAYAKAAIDIALWDIAGKTYGMRVCDLLGGALRERVPSYYAIGIETPAEAARIAQEKQAEGYPRLQLKVGGRHIEEDIAAIRQVSEVLNAGIRFAADANCGWTARDAMLVSQACRDVPFVIEQPCATYAETASLRGRVCHPIYLDEVTEDLNTIVRAIGDRSADGFGLKVTRMGGLSAMRTIRDLCHRHNLPHTCDDAWGGDILAAACLHIGATVAPRLCEGVWIAAPYIEGHYDPENGIETKNGWLDLPQRDGLGVHPDVSCWGSPVYSVG